MFGMEAVNSEVSTGEKTFPEGRFGRSPQINTNQSPGSISTIHSEKIQIREDIILEKSE